MASPTEDPLFCDEWSAEDELKLLESIDEYGYGNWSSIAAKVDKTAEECQFHYNQFYLNYPHRPNSPRLGPFSLSSSCNRDDVEPVYYPGIEIEGYMPHRGDFAVEPLEDAEHSIAEMEWEPEDDQLITALKLSALDIYQSKLKQRMYRKNIVRDYGLLDIRRQEALDKSRLTRSQLKLKQQFRPLMRFMKPETAEKFLQSYFVEEEKSEEVRRLQSYRENGIRTLKGAELYEKLLVRRKEQKIQLQKDLSSSCATEEALFCQIFNLGNAKHTKRVFKDRPLDITYAAGVGKLNLQEKELCCQCRIQPEAFLHFKQQLVAECDKTGRLRLAEARKLLKIDVNKTRRIYNLLLTKELIKCD